MNKKQTVSNADIVIINDNNLGFLGGERESQLIIINGVASKHRVAVIQPGEFNETIDNVDFYWCTKCKRMKQLIKNPFAFLAYIFKVGKLIRKINPKIIHSNSQVSFFIVSLLKRFRLINRKITLIHTDRGLYTKYNSFFRKLFQFSFKHLNVLVTTTNFNKESWQEANEKKKIPLQYSVIYNTAGEIYENIDENRLCDNSYLTVGFAGRMCDWKDWPLAEKICDETDKLVPDTRYVMYISCLDDNAKLDTEQLFERMRSKYGDRFEGKVNVPFAQMEEFYYKTDVYILTSYPKSESFGRTIVEAMSRKTAVLTTDAGGSVEVVNDPNTVCSEAVEFAWHIETWYNDRELLNIVKERNLERVHSEYTLENNVSSYRELYDQYIDNEKAE